MIVLNMIAIPEGVLGHLSATKIVHAVLYKPRLLILLHAKLAQDLQQCLGVYVRKCRRLKSPCDDHCNFNDLETTAELCPMSQWTKREHFTFWLEYCFAGKGSTSTRMKPERRTGPQILPSSLQLRQSVQHCQEVSHLYWHCDVVNAHACSAQIRVDKLAINSLATNLTDQQDVRKKPAAARVADSHDLTNSQ